MGNNGKPYRVRACRRGPDIETFRFVRVNVVRVQYVGERRRDAAVKLAKGFTTRESLPVLFEGPVGCRAKIRINLRLRKSSKQRNTDLRQTIHNYRLQLLNCSDRRGGFTRTPQGAANQGGEFGITQMLRENSGGSVAVFCEAGIGL